MGISKTLLASILAAMGSTSVPLQFGLNIYGITGALPASGNAIVTIIQVAPVSAINLVITTSRSTGVAPLAVTFDAIATTAPTITSLPFSEINYFWNFDDENGETWDYGTRPGVNSKNEAFGPVAAHVFKAHGGKVPTCYASWLGPDGTLHTATATTSITVTDPDTVFASNTIYISQSGVPVPGVDGVPPGATVQQVTTWSTVETLAQTYKRILLKRGDTWSVTAGVYLDQVSRTGQGIIGAYGTGAKPNLQLNYDGTVLRATSVVSDWRFVDLAITANGPGPRPFSRSFSFAGGDNMLLLRCEAQGSLYGISTLNNNGVYVVDTVLGPSEPYVSGPAGYSIFSGGNINLHLLGSQWNGATNHGVRLQGVVNSSVDSCAGSGNNAGIPGHVFTLRGWNPHSGTNWTENVVVSRSTFAGNANNIATLTCSPQNTSSSECLRNVILDGNYITSTTSGTMNCEVVSGFTVRNNIFFTAAWNSIDIQGLNTSGTPLPIQQFWYNNTFYCSASGTNLTVFAISGTVSGIVFTNNIGYGPNFSTAQITNGTGGQVTLLNNSSNAQIISSLPFVNATPTLAAHFAPAGYAVNGGAWVPVYKNFYGTTNSAPREIGAI